MAPLWIIPIGIVFGLIAKQPAPEVPPAAIVRDRVILLPSQDGKPSAVIVTTATREQVLDQAYQSARVDTASGIVATTENADSIALRYGDVLAAMPPRPIAFTVHFNSGAQELNAASQQVLSAVKAEIARRPAAEIVVVGHTDRVGNPAANDALSLQRAKVVRDILVFAGVNAASIDVAGRGEREPVVQTAAQVAEPANRRTEIVVR